MRSRGEHGHARVVHGTRKSTLDAQLMPGTVAQQPAGDLPTDPDARSKDGRQDREVLKFEVVGQENRHGLGPPAATQHGNQPGQAAG